MNIDILVNIVKPTVSTQTGHRSVYTEKTHEGTEKKIQGWQWGKFRWPNYSRLSSSSYIPSVFDANLAVDKSYYQSGFGSGTDLKLKNFSLEHRKIAGRELRAWAPVIQAGYYHIHNTQWYLFSDQYITEKLDLTSSGVHTLLEVPKDLAPIFIRNYKRDVGNSELSVNKELNYRIFLDENGQVQAPESGFFSLDVSDPSSVKINFNVSDVSETPIPIQFTVTDETLAIQLPVFPAEINSVPANWTYDQDLGLLRRGESAQNGVINITYTPSYVITYEPSFSLQEVVALSADTNPLKNGLNKGFVQITTEILDPYSIELVTDLQPFTSSTIELYDYVINLGNNVAQLEATVKNKAGTLLEGIRVYFDWEGHDGWGGENIYNDYGDDPSSLTNYNGIAAMNYHSPSTIKDIGFYVHKDDVVLNGSNNSEITISDFSPSTNEQIFIYQVRYDDNFSGLDAAGVAAAYQDYWQQEEISDETANQAYEERYRKKDTISGVRPFAITIDGTDPNEIRGQKRMIFEEDTSGDYIDTNTTDANEIGTRSSSGNIVLKPLKPIEVQPVSDSDFMLTYQPNLKDVGGDKVYQYFIASNKKIKAKAWAYNALGQRIFSNEVMIRITLSDSINGVYYTDALNGIPDIYKQKLLRTVGWDGTLPHPTSNAKDITNDISSDAEEAYIPLGFRIKDAGITVAGLLDQVTFISKPKN